MQLLVPNMAALDAMISMEVIWEEAKTTHSFIVNTGQIVSFLIVVHHNLYCTFVIKVLYYPVLSQPPDNSVC